MIRHARAMAANQPPRRALVCLRTRRSCANGMSPTVGERPTTRRPAYRNSALARNANPAIASRTARLTNASAIGSGVSALATNPLTATSTPQPGTSGAVRVVNAAAASSRSLTTTPAASSRLWPVACESSSARRIRDSSEAIARSPLPALSAPRPSIPRSVAARVTRNKSAAPPVPVGAVAPGRSLVAARAAAEPLEDPRGDARVAAHVDAFVGGVRGDPSRRERVEQAGLNGDDRVR